MLDAADRALSLVAERLEAMGSAPWTGEQVDPLTLQFVTGELQPDLYAGLSGLALSFAAVADATGSARHERLALDATRRLRAQIEAGSLRHCDVGLEGLGGIAWASHRVWSLLDSDDAVACLKQTCEALVATLARRERAVHVDLVGGEAGALAAVLTLIEAEAIAGDLLATTGRHLVDLLLAASITVPEGRVWPIFDGDHVVGLGHGTSGIMLALHRAAAILEHRTDEIDAVIDATVTYEDATFDRTVGNWHDGRVADDLEPWNCWCYGAAGTQFVRQRLGRRAPAGCVDPIAGDAPPVDHLCCGRAGRLLMARASDHPDAAALATALARRVLDDTAVVGGNRVDTAPDLDALRRSTGLFLGMAGIAYALIQAPHPEAVDLLVLG